MSDDELPDRDVDVVAHAMGETHVLMYEKANVGSWIVSNAWIHRDEAV